MTMPWINAGVWVLVGLTAGLALFAAFLIWRDGYVRGWHAARSGPPTCLKCGYNLSGMTHCRCPECGAEFRMDELWHTHLFPRRFEAKDVREKNGGTRRRKAI